MGRYTIIQASQDQIDALYRKHLGEILSTHFSYDDEDNIGFVELTTKSGKTVEYQLRRNRPMFVSFTGFNGIRYDISYPEGDMYTKLKKLGTEAQENFWKGGKI